MPAPPPLPRPVATSPRLAQRSRLPVAPSGLADDEDRAHPRDVAGPGRVPERVLGHGSWRRPVLVLPELAGGGLLGDDVRVSLAHVDTPKGDLDMSGRRPGPTTTLITGSTVYPYGTTEQPRTRSTRRARSSITRRTTTWSARTRASATASRASAASTATRARSASAPTARTRARRHVRDDRRARGGRRRQHLRALGQGHDDGLLVRPGLLGADCSSRMRKYGIDPFYIDDEPTARLVGDLHRAPGRPGLDGTYATVPRRSAMTSSPSPSRRPRPRRAPRRRLRRGAPEHRHPERLGLLLDFQGAYNEMLGCTTTRRRPTAAS